MSMPGGKEQASQGKVAKGLERLRQLKAKGLIVAAFETSASASKQGSTAFIRRAETAAAAPGEESQDDGERQRRLDWSDRPWMSDVSQAEGNLRRHNTSVGLGLAALLVAIGALSFFSNRGNVEASLRLQDERHGNVQRELTDIADRLRELDQRLRQLENWRAGRGVR